MQARASLTSSESTLMRCFEQSADFQALLREHLFCRDVTAAILAYNLLQDKERRLSHARLFSATAHHEYLEELFLKRILHRLQAMAAQQRIRLSDYFRLANEDIKQQRTLDIELAVKQEIEFTANLVLALSNKHDNVSLLPPASIQNHVPHHVVEMLIGAGYKSAITGQTAAWQLGFSDKWLLNVTTPVGFGFGIGAAIFSAFNTLLVPAIYLYYTAKGYDVRVTGLTKAKVAASAGITALTILGLAFPPAAAAVLVGFGVVSVFGSLIEMIDHGLKRRKHPRLMRESEARQAELQAELDAANKALAAGHLQLCALFTLPKHDVARTDLIQNEMVHLKYVALDAQKRLSKEQETYRGLQQASRVVRSNLQTTMTAVDVAVGAAILVGAILAAIPFTAPAGVLLVTIATGISVAAFIARKIHQAWADHKVQHDEAAAREAQADVEPTNSAQIYQHLDAVPEYSLEDTESESKLLLDSAGTNDLSDFSDDEDLDPATSHFVSRISSAI